VLYFGKVTLYQFIALDEDPQAEALWDCGVHLANREHGEHTVLLYQLDGFYVEVFYQKKLNAITRLRPFATTNLLQPYLDQIPLTFDI
jgi:hypothetical protein